MNTAAMAGKKTMSDTATVKNQIDEADRPGEKVPPGPFTKNCSVVGMNHMAPTAPEGAR